MMDQVHYEQTRVQGEISRALRLGVVELAICPIAMLEYRRGAEPQLRHEIGATFGSSPLRFSVYPLEGSQRLSPRVRVTHHLGYFLGRFQR